ncbi:phosphoribosyl transferase domain protein [Daldinia vernicosa]|uniref:phosphoribosyl transferase domain protein n=1 Tax=Daldinia vernicosa TaxID=114800 RepID=UPI00200869CD|nr:phosphoribosyl transferase domain protein [Daldinia vernicosa]KAI0850385.1 phosphoribosyl transferase domain protein [Daldinia vernicosa]
MATIHTLKGALRQRAAEMASCPTQPLSDAQYGAGFDIIIQGLGWTIYRDFIIPQLSQLLTPLFNSRANISVLEIGPGPKSILGYLPSLMRQKVKKYDAFEPNNLFAARLEEWFNSPAKTDSPLPNLGGLPNIHKVPFVLDDRIGRLARTDADDDNKYDVVLFCHSMYGMKPHHKFIEQGLRLLDKQQEGAMVVVFHHDETLDLAGLVCHRTASYPAGVISVADDDETVDLFAAFVVGYVIQDVDTAVKAEWRKVCRMLGRRDEAHAGYLLFSSPDVMVAFNRHGTSLAELTAHVPLVKGDRIVKNREANFHRPASIMRPTEIRHVQHCVQWALKHTVGLTVLSGGHSGHCLQFGVVSVDMTAFNKIHIHTTGETKEGEESGLSSFVVAEAGCKTGDIINKTMEAGLTVPLGARPSVGAGLWLQGGIGHLARLHGLACDAIIGAVVVSVDSGQVLYVGHVPSQYRPADAVRPQNEADLLWAIKGAGTNFGIVISVIFRAHAAPTYWTRNWVFPLKDNIEARRKLSNFDKLVARDLPRNFSADAYLYWDANQLHLGVTMFESSTTMSIREILGPEDNLKKVDGVGLFETEMYMSGMHGGHGGGKTSSFKRCLFLNDIGEANIFDILVMAIETRPSPLCYLHLLHGGKAVSDIKSDATAFGCRDWDFACVITGVWPRDKDGTETARAAVRWVYNVANNLLPLSSGAYGADLGPDPRDAALATKAFGPNRSRLAHLKRKLDPYNILAYACPLRKAPREPRLIILVTGESCAGKDYCADIWVSELNDKGLAACAVSISDATKREYAAASGADLNRLLLDRAYKEQHRPALTAFWKDQARRRPRLPGEHFLNVVHGAEEIDVLLITGMRDEAPVATLSYLVPHSRLLEVRVQASEEMRRARGGSQGAGPGGGEKTSNYRPNFIFNNNMAGDEIIKNFVERTLLPFFHEDLQRLANMVRPVPDFPRRGIKFRHVLDISQQPGGLTLCTSLLQTHFTGDWANVSAMVSCEAGGFIFASALATQVDVPLALIREAGKLPPPTISIAKSTSHISSSTSNNTGEKRIEMERDAIPRGVSVVVIDDVLATGETLCGTLQLLNEAGIKAENISIMVVAEFPAHRGREVLRQRGFGTVNIQSLLVYDGA